MSSVDDKLADWIEKFVRNQGMERFLADTRKGRIREVLSDLLNYHLAITLSETIGNAKFGQ